MIFVEIISQKRRMCFFLNGWERVCCQHSVSGSDVLVSVIKSQTYSVASAPPAETCWACMRPFRWYIWPRVWRNVFILHVNLVSFLVILTGSAHKRKTDGVKVIFYVHLRKGYFYSITSKDTYFSYSILFYHCVGWVKSLNRGWGWGGVGGWYRVLCIGCDREREFVGGGVEKIEKSQ